MNCKITAIASMLVALASGQAFSQQAYVGVAAGTSHQSIDCTGLDSCDKSGTGIKVLGGYEFVRDLAAEAMYYSLGKAVLRSGDLTADVKGSYWGLGVAYRPQFHDGWGAVVRTGAAFTTGKIEIEGQSQSRHSTQAYLGLGATYALTKSLKAELDWDRTRLEIGTDDNHTKGTVNGFSLGVNFGF